MIMIQTTNITDAMTVTIEKLKLDLAQAKLDLVQAAAKQRATEMLLADSRLALDNLKFYFLQRLSPARDEMQAALAKIQTLECAASGQRVPQPEVA